MPTGFNVNAHRYDPYKNFKFRVKNEDNVTVLGVSKVTPLRRTTEVVKHRSGGENSHDHKSPGRTTYEGVTMERGITHDMEFTQWASRVHAWSGHAGCPGRIRSARNRFATPVDRRSARRHVTVTSNDKIALRRVEPCRRRD